MWGRASSQQLRTVRTACRAPPPPPLSRASRHTHPGSRSTFPGMGPEAESNPAALKIKYMGLSQKIVVFVPIWLGIKSRICTYHFSRRHLWLPLALREKDQHQLTTRGPGSTVCTASLRKSAEPASWPHTRRVPGERSAGRKSITISRRVVELACPNIRHQSFKCPKTHERAQLGPAGTDMRHHPGDIPYIWGSGRTRRENRIIIIKHTKEITIKCPTKSKESIQIPLWIPLSHIPPRN